MHPRKCIVLLLAAHPQKCVPVPWLGHPRKVPAAWVFLAGQAEDVGQRLVAVAGSQLVDF